LTSPYREIPPVHFQLCIDVILRFASPLMHCVIGVVVVVVQAIRTQLKHFHQIGGNQLLFEQSMVVRMGDVENILSKQVGL
jgi:hypothetical protein